MITCPMPEVKYLDTRSPTYQARAVVLNAVGDRYSRPPLAQGGPGCLLDTSGHLAQ
jgi:hypothetical protein